MTSTAGGTSQSEALPPAEISPQRVRWWRPDLVYKTFRQETDSGRFLSAVATVPTCIVGPLYNRWEAWPEDGDER